MWHARALTRPGRLARQGYTSQAGRYAETALTFDALRPHDPFFPVGSPERAWIEAHGEAIRAEQNATAAAGLRVMNHIDFPILPRKVLEAYAATMCRNASASPCEASFASESPLLTVLDAMMAELFEKFPLLEGVIIRTGEHYIIDLPYHQAVGIRASGPTDSEAASSLAGFLLSEAQTKLPLLSRAFPSQRAVAAAQF